MLLKDPMIYFFGARPVLTDEKELLAEIIFRCLAGARNIVEYTLHSQVNANYKVNSNKETFQYNKWGEGH